ncbi:MAG: ABC transporter permease subunit, partial [Gammaproteobacteria bacterium]|nr:ABC transporter permease subunit [Gammaproteobacteria bacterium]
MGDIAVPEPQAAADIAVYLKNISGIESPPRVTLNNYIDAIVGYRGTTTYSADCAAGTQPLDINCDASDILNPRGMGRAFLNSLFVTLPATILPILFAAFAGYAFAWLDFKGRFVLFAVLVGLQVVPLQMTLVPISRLYAQAGLNGTFLGVWLFHTGFGMPYAIYLMRNFLGSLPRDLFESAYLDGASHWTAFRRLVIPLAMPAIASLSIFQFL